MLLSDIQLAPLSDRNALGGGVGFLLAFPMCLSMLCKIIFKITESRSMYIPNNNSADLFRCVRKRGKRDGYLNRNGNQFQPELQPQEEPILVKSNPGLAQKVKTILGGIASYSRNLVGEFWQRLCEIKIRNPERR